MRIENWSLVPAASPFIAPEAGGICVAGKVYGNPNFSEGCPITTSRVVKLRVGDNLLGVVTKSGSFYELGEVDPLYEAEYPGARERLKAQADLG